AGLESSLDRKGMAGTAAAGLHDRILADGARQPRIHHDGRSSAALPVSKGILRDRVRALEPARPGGHSIARCARSPRGRELMNTAQGPTSAAWRLDDLDTIESLVQGRHGDPFAVLGPRPVSGGTVLRVMRPGADAAEAIGDDGRSLGKLLRRHQAGFFEGMISHKGEPLSYRLRFNRGSDVWVEDDLYRFPSTFGDLDLHLLGEGRHQRLYERLGAQPLSCDGVEGTRFAVWAPNARRVSVVGDFNHWDGRRHVMRHLGTGIWEIFVPGVNKGAHYKYEFLSSHGHL